MKQQIILCWAAQIHAGQMGKRQSIGNIETKYYYLNWWRACIEIKSQDLNTLLEQSAGFNYSNRTFIALLRNSLKNPGYAPMTPSCRQIDLPDIILSTSLFWSGIVIKQCQKKCLFVGSWHHSKVQTITGMFYMLILHKPIDSWILPTIINSWY